MTARSSTRWAALCCGPASALAHMQGAALSFQRVRGYMPRRMWLSELGDRGVYACIAHPHTSCPCQISPMLTVYEALMLLQHVLHRSCSASTRT
jgi:hypothetical protein